MKVAVLKAGMFVLLLVSVSSLCRGGEGGHSNINQDQQQRRYSPAMAEIDLVISEQMLSDVLALYSLSSEQSKTATSLHASYLQRIEEIERQLLRDFDKLHFPAKPENPGADDEENRRYGERSAQVMGKAFNLIGQAHRVADRALFEFLEKLRRMSSDKDPVRPERVLKLLRRWTYYARPERHTGDFSHRLDIFQLVDEATSPGGELADTASKNAKNRASPDEAHMQRQFDKRLKEILQEYAAGLDQVLLREYQKTRNLPEPRAETSMPMRWGTPKHTKLRRKFGRRWWARQAPHIRAARAIANAADTFHSAETR